MASLYTHAATNATDLLSKTSLPSDIYSGIDFSSLSLREHHTGLMLHVDAELDRYTVEQYWAKWYIMIGDPVLATGLMSFLLHEVR